MLKDEIKKGDKVRLIVPNCKDRVGFFVGLNNKDNELCVIKRISKKGNIRHEVYHKSFIFPFMKGDIEMEIVLKKVEELIIKHKYKRSILPLSELYSWLNEIKQKGEL